jgi:hypothetical protein
MTAAREESPLLPITDASANGVADTAVKPSSAQVFAAKQNLN